MRGMEITLGTSARVFWAYMWRAFLLGFGLGIVLGIAKAATGVPSQALDLLNIVMGSLLGFWVLGLVFRKRYKHFSVQLIDNTSGAVRAPSHMDTLRIWWSWFWRSMVLGLVVVLLPLVLGGVVKGKDLVDATTRHACAQLTADYQRTAADPAKAAQAAQMVAQYQELQCADIMQRVPEDQGMTAFVGFSIMMFLGGGLIGIVVQLKIIQLLLRKTYRAFHVRVTANEEATPALDQNRV